MSSVEQPNASQEPSEGRFFRHLDYQNLPHDISKALTARNHAVARALIQLAQQTEVYRDHPMDLARAHLLDLSMPRQEQHDTLLRERSIDGQLTQELDEIYLKTSQKIAEFMHYRQEAERSSASDAHQKYLEYLGAVSEFTVFGLYNRLGSTSPYIATASTPDQDYGQYNDAGESTAYDMNIQRTDDPYTTVHAQIKTARSFRVYSKTNMLVSVADLAGSTHGALYTLPSAIVHEVEGGVPKHENRILERATRMLYKRTEANLALQKLFEK